jgi:hypothetical protein
MKDEQLHDYGHIFGENLGGGFMLFHGHLARFRLPWSNELHSAIKIIRTSGY